MILSATGHVTDHHLPVNVNATSTSYISSFVVQAYDEYAKRLRPVLALETQWHKTDEELETAVRKDPGVVVSAKRARESGFWAFDAWGIFEQDQLLVTRRVVSCALSSEVLGLPRLRISHACASPMTATRR